MSQRIKFKEDPKFIHLDQTLKCLAYCFVHHLDYWIQIASQQSTTEWSRSLQMMGNVDAGRIYNNLLISQPFGKEFVTNTELSESQYEDVVATFNAAVMKQPKLSYIAKHIGDPHECMWEFCHYLFVPVRMQAESIPKNMRMQSLKKWIDVVFTLPFNSTYTNKFSTAINNVGYIQDVFNKLIDDPTKISRFTQIEDSWVFNTIARTYNKDHPTQMFIRLFMNILLVSSVEILKKYCPNFSQCVAVNPDYDGSWLNPFDPQHMTHLQEINKLTTLLSL